jgi:hypothetical protein
LPPACETEGAAYDGSLKARQTRRPDFFEPMFAYANEATKKSGQRSITGF